MYRKIKSVNKNFDLYGGQNSIDDPEFDITLISPKSETKEETESLPTLPTYDVQPSTEKTESEETMEKPDVSKNIVQISRSDRNNLPYMDPSRLKLYTIPEGTILYHGSMYMETFNPMDIKLNDETLVAYFSPNKEIAADYIMRCSMYPGKSGYIHMFRVKKDIDKIRILSKYDLKEGDKSPIKIEKNFCIAKPNREYLNGIGFFFPSKDISEFTDFNNTELSEQILQNSEFALCNPNLYLEYISTQKCIANRKLGNLYNFYQ